jgi:hypothetical protein
MRVCVGGHRTYILDTQDIEALSHLLCMFFTPLQRDTFMRPHAGRKEKGVGFASQLEWRPYGHLICTPVCLLVGTSFVNGVELSEEYVRRSMNQSHALYAECFAAQKQPLKLQELYELLPRGQFEVHEAAGMLVTPAVPGSEAEDLLVLPLAGLLQRALAEPRRACVIVTALDHTTCFLAEGAGGGEKGRLEVFDPLPSSLIALPTAPAQLEEALLQRYGQHNASALFSAALMVRQDAPAAS